MTEPLFGATRSLGRIARLPFRLIPKSAVLPILWGPLRGQKWIYGSGLVSAWFGTYERDKQKVLAATAHLGAVVYDIGANVGFHSLLCARLVGPTGRVYAFEPVPRNLEYLRKHVELSGSSGHIEIIDKAVSDSEGSRLFDEGPNAYVGHLSDAGCLEVSCVALDALAARLRKPDVIKIDAEGAEFLVLQGAEKVLRTSRPKILLATHTEQLAVECRAFLTALNYSLSNIAGASDEFLAVPA